MKIIFMDGFDVTLKQMLHTRGSFKSETAKPIGRSSKPPIVTFATTLVKHQRSHTSTLVEPVGN